MQTRLLMAGCLMLAGLVVAACEQMGLRSETPAAAGAAASAGPLAAPAVPGRKPVLYCIGDSTMKNGGDTGPVQWGYGHILHYYFDESKITVENDAVGGTSSRSFMKTASMWPRVLAKLQPGDYVLMQFGHNDNTMPPESDTLRYRSTIKGNGDETVQGPAGLNEGMETIHSYGWYMRQYCIQTKAKGATPIVVSMIPRNGWSPAGKKNRNTNDYALWAKQAAEQTGALFVPLNDLVADEYEKLGQQYVTANLWPPGESTHPNWAGAKLNAAMAAKGIAALNDPIKNYLNPDPKAPDVQDVPVRGGAAGGRGAATASRPAL